MKSALRFEPVSRWNRSVLVLPLALWANACTGRVDDPAHPAEDASPDAVATLDSGIDAPADAAPDVTGDVTTSNDGGPSSDAACVPSPVWLAGDEGFTYAQLGGFTAAPAPDAGCSEVGSTYEYSVASKMLTQHLCNFDALIDNTVRLTDLEASELVTKLESLRTTCPPYSSCGADYPGQSLSVRPHGAAPVTPVTYSGDFYAGCGGGDPLTPPYIAYTAMADLGDTLYHLVQGPAGASSDSGAGAD